MTWKRRLTILAVVLLVAMTIFYLGWIRRAREVVERDGWLLQYTYIPLACRTCTGHVERLECNGQLVPVPRLKMDRYGQRRQLVVSTPVGTFRAYAKLDRWRFFHSSDNRPGAIQGSITDDELSRGYYSAAAASKRHRKEGTPDHWCWAWTSYDCRWLDPQLLDDLDWQDTDPDWQDPSAK